MLPTRGIGSSSSRLPRPVKLQSFWRETTLLVELMNTGAAWLGAARKSPCVREAHNEFYRNTFDRPTKLCRSLSEIEYARLRDLRRALREAFDHGANCPDSVSSAPGYL